jgi:hypothetical protein
VNRRTRTIAAIAGAVLALFVAVLAANSAAVAPAGDVTIPYQTPREPTEPEPEPEPTPTWPVKPGCPNCF